MKKRSLLCLLSMMLMVAPFCLARDLRISSVTLTGQNTTDHYAMVQFNMEWKDSWKDQFNWDAAWVFVKYQYAGNSAWNHAFLNSESGNHNIPSGYACSVGLTGGNGMGVFVFKSDSGGPDNIISNMQLRWDYGLNGVGEGATVTVKVFAVEMVYVPQGAFYLGNAVNDTAACFYQYGTTGPYQVTSENAINIGQTSGYLWAQGSRFIETSTLPAGFPKGYGAFYCMKYELSQGQWVDFFNTLTETQKVNHDVTGEFGKGTDAVSYRNTVSWTSGDATCTRPDRTGNFLSWPDEAAYADWAGLRPMTELEYEKACRGNQAVNDCEYAWGTTNITAATTISGSEDGTETIANAGANCCYGNATFTGGDGESGPLRCGIFARSATTREEAGSSFYGIMELSGNVCEQVINVAEANGRNFTGVQGDGYLDADGYANVSTWPGLGQNGIAARGGHYSYASSYMMMVDRRISSIGGNIMRGGRGGIRLVRSTP